MVVKETVMSKKVENNDSLVPELVATACQFNSEIHLESGSARLNAKSIMGLMALKFFGGKEVRITADGNDEQEAVNSLEAILV